MPRTRLRNVKGNGSNGPLKSSHVFSAIQKRQNAMDAPMNFQLPPNSASLSAARSARVRLAASSSLALRETRWRGQLVGTTQAMNHGCQYPQSDIRILMQESPKIIARQNGQTRVRRHGGIGRARLLVDNCHFAKELAVMQVGQRCVVAIGIFDTDADAPGFDEIHRVAGIAALEKGVPPAASRTVSRLHKLERRRSSRLRKRGTERSASTFIFNGCSKGGTGPPVRPAREMRSACEFLLNIVPS